MPPARRTLRNLVARACFGAHPAGGGRKLPRARESQWWSAEQIEGLQTARLRRLAQAAASVPFYRERFREAGVDPAAIHSLNELRRLPPLEREELAENGLSLRTPGEWGLRASSSGSAGSPVRVLWSREEMGWRDASEERGREWLGIGPGERRLEVRCRPVTRAQAVSAALLNTKAIHAGVASDPSALERLAHSLKRDPPSLVNGVSNAIYEIALALLAQGRTVPARACWSGGNHLHPHYRAALESAFECPVFEKYATMETGLIAHECPDRGSMHVAAEGVIAEIVRPDGSAAGPGEMGDVLITSLRNRALPLIRYRIGDRAIAPEPGLCPCGRGLPVFGTIVGRDDGFLLTGSGDVVTPKEVVDLVRSATESVIDFQVIQDEDTGLRVLVTQRDAPPSETDRERIAAALGELVQPPAPPRVERVEGIPLTPGGKLKTLVTRAGR